MESSAKTMFRLCCTGVYAVLMILLACAIFYQRKRKPGRPERRSNRGIPVSLSLAIVGMVVLSYAWYVIPFSVVIDRDCPTSAERAALERAEALDLASVLGISRYYYWGLTNETPAGPNAYVWPNLVDRKALEFYSQKICRARDSMLCFDASLKYSAVARLRQDLRIGYDASSHKAFINANDYNVNTASEGHARYNEYEYAAIAGAGGLERITTVTGPMNLSLDRSYVVAQSLEYSEMYGSLAGFAGGADQIIVLDDGYLPCLILIRPGSYTVA